jgi:hypothetical protein
LLEKARETVASVAYPIICAFYFTNTPGLLSSYDGNVLSNVGSPSCMKSFLKKNRRICSLEKPCHLAEKLTDCAILSGGNVAWIHYCILATHFIIAAALVVQLLKFGVRSLP